MQIEELHKALATLTKEESLSSISRKEKVTHQAIGKRRDRILEKTKNILGDKI